MFFKYSCEKTFEKKLWKTSIYRRNSGFNKFFKGFPAFNKVPNSLRQVLQIYSQICNFCVPQKSPPEAVSKD